MLPKYTFLNAQARESRSVEIRGTKSVLTECERCTDETSPSLPGGEETGSHRLFMLFMQ